MKQVTNKSEKPGLVPRKTIGGGKVDLRAGRSASQKGNNLI